MIIIFANSFMTLIVFISPECLTVSLQSEGLNPVYFYI